MSHYKPYPAYKDSGVEWLGRVPEHWAVTKIGRTLLEPPCYGVLVPDFEMDGVPMLRITDMEHEKIDKSGLVTISHELSAQYSRTIVRQGDVVLSVVGTIGKSFAVSEQLAGCNLSRAVARIQPSDKISPSYLCKVFESSAFTRFVDLTCLGSAQRVLNMGDLSGLLFCIPAVEEQTAICAHLDRETARIDALVAKKTRFIELLREKRQALITHAVTKGLDPNVKMKDSGVEWLGEVPEHWKVKKLKYLCRIQTGDKDTVNAVDDGQYPFFVRSQTVERIDSFTADCEAVLTAGDGVGVGKVFHYYDGKFDFHQRVYMFNQFSLVNGRFFYFYLLSNFHKVALDGGAKSTVDSLRLPLIQNFDLTIPPAYEQEEILAFIESQIARLDVLTSKSERSIDLLKERRSALITAAVTGQIDLREAV